LAKDQQELAFQKLVDNDCLREQNLALQEQQPFAQHFYCQICHLNYQDFSEHLKCELHQAKIKQQTYWYGEIDKVFSELSLETRNDFEGQDDLRDPTVEEIVPVQPVDALEALFPQSGGGHLVNQDVPIGKPDSQTIDFAKALRETPRNQTIQSTQAFT
jgi:hypothetical protein